VGRYFDQGRVLVEWRADQFSEFPAMTVSRAS